MAENNKNISPDAENEPVNGADENTAALSDASEIKAQENENVSVEKTAEPTDDDVLSEIKEALDKAEKSGDEDNIFPDKSRSSSDSRFEPITEDDFKLPHDLDTDKTILLDDEKSDTIGANADAENLSALQKANRPTRRSEVTKTRIVSADTGEDNKAETAKKSSPGKIILLILAVVAVAAALFALVHFVIAPMLSGNGGKNAADQTSAEAESAAPTESVYEAKAADTLSSMLQRDKICQLFVVTPEMLMNTDIVTVVDNTTAPALENYPVGGVILTQQSITGDDQTKALISGLQDNSKIPLFIAQDDDAIISEQATGQNGVDTTADGAYNNAVAAAQQKSNLGFNIDFSLNADLSDARATKPDLSDADAGNIISSAVKGYNENNVIPSLKYFPGILDAKNSTDASDAFLHIGKSADELDAGSEFGAFRSGIESGAGMVMVDHIYVDQLDTERPATLSDKVVPQLLREKLNYQGVVITGDMSKGYFTREYKYSTIVKGIFSSDIDLILNPNSIQSYVQEIENLLNSGEITQDQLDAKVKRILTLKYQSGLMDDAVNATESVDATTASAETTGETTTETTAETVAPTE